MKLMLICDYPMSPSEIDGGVAAAAYNLVQALLEHTPIEIVVIGYWPDFVSSSPAITDHSRLRIVRCPWPKPRGHLRGFRAERKIFSSFIRDERPDIVHAQSEGIYASVAVNSGCPNVYTIHGVRLKELVMERSEMSTISYHLRAWLIQQHHRKATNIVAINRYTENEIRGLHNAKVRVIHNAVDESFFELYSTDEKEPGILLQVGGARARKDPITCLEAVVLLMEKKLPVKLDIVGPNTDDAMPQVEAFIEKHDLREVVRIHGLVSAEDVENFYRNADIFVMSSLEESSPIAIVQAMAAGLPVVSTNVGGISEMVEDKKNSFLIDPGDSRALAEKIERLILDRNLRQSFSGASRNLAINDWSNKAVALKTYQMYKEIISER